MNKEAHIGALMVAGGLAVYETYYLFAIKSGSLSVVLTLICWLLVFSIYSLYEKSE